MIGNLARITSGKPAANHFEPSRPKDDPLGRMNARASKDCNKAKPQSKAPKQSKPNTRPPDENIVETYDYTKANGTLLYQVVRYDPKDSVSAAQMGAVDGSGNLTPGTFPTTCRPGDG